MKTYEIEFINADGKPQLETVQANNITHALNQFFSEHNEIGPEAIFRIEQQGHSIPK